MTKPIPDGCDRPIPHLTCKGAADAIEFYKKALGAEELFRMPSEDGRLMHAEIAINGSPVYLTDDFPECCGGKEHNPGALGGSPVKIHLYVEDCDAAIKQAEEAGAKVTMPAQNMFWGDRYGSVEDPFGHQWSFATHVKDLSPEEIAKGAAAAFG